ncbi:cellulose synthase [Oryzifoliimicrobium ureilyticus]|uniref:cellulose synthase n=1 Tax=Oryzifoliimicrobium ureilyticus TaxID=3113724 RepID=UPI0030761465
MKPTLVAVAAAAVVALLITGLKDRSALRSRLGLGEEPAQVMMMGRLQEPNGQSVSSGDQMDTMAAKVREATQAPAPTDVQGTEAQKTEATKSAAPKSETPPPVEQQQSQQQQAQATQQPAQQPVPSSQQEVDESALRYFASKGDKARLQAEISRLQALYPNWVPPADPLAVPQNGDPQLEAMWRLYADGRYAELRKAIADRRTADPAWAPPADLLERLDIAEARQRLVNASDLKQYETVIGIGASAPSLLTCADLDVLWRVAEAFAKTEREERAADAYSYILKNCSDPQQRLATIQKAAGLTSYSTMQRLLAFEKKDANGKGEFGSLRDDLARRFVAEANEDTKLQISQDYVQRLETVARAQGQASDALLLGWYNYRRQDTAAAEEWFRAARAKQDSAFASQGLSLVLIEEKKPQEAEDVMYKWREDSDEAMATYLAAVANLLAQQPPADLKEDVLARMAAETVRQKNVAAAQQFGWYSRILNQPQTAAHWFEAALSWKADDEPSAYGLALTRSQLNDQRGLAELQRAWAGRSARIETLGETVRPNPNGQPQPNLAPSAGLRNVAPQVAASTLEAPRQPSAQQSNATYASEMRSMAVQRGGRQDTAGCTATVDVSTLSPSAALSRGWCLMNLNRPMEAVAAFEAALSSQSRQDREDAAYGQSLAYLRAGLSNNAAVAATKAPQRRERAMELQVAILSDRAVTAFRAKRYREALVYLDQRAQLKQETTDLLVLRGYSYYNLKMYDDALRVFETAAATGNKDANRGIADIRAALYPDKTN